MHPLQRIATKIQALQPLFGPMFCGHLQIASALILPIYFDLGRD
jgi:hypothetical protein